MFCENCGAENRNDRKFCSNCGSPLRDYTKPKENLIMSNEVEQEQKKVRMRNHIKNVSTILMCVFFVCAVALTIVSFFIKNFAFWVIIGLAFAFYIALLITFIIRSAKLKRLKDE